MPEKTRMRVGRQRSFVMLDEIRSWNRRTYYPAPRLGTNSFRIQTSPQECARQVLANEHAENRDLHVVTIFIQIDRGIDARLT